MKIAKVRYTGRKGKHTRRLPSGETFNFRRRDRGDPWTAVDSAEAARYFENTMNYEVQWTARGRLLAKGSDVLDLGYQKKRSLASELDLSFDGQPDEDDLDESIEEMIDSLEQQ